MSSGPGNTVHLAGLSDDVEIHRDEVAGLTGLSSPQDGARALRDLGAHAVIVKMDADGCFGVSDEGEFSLPAIPGDVVD